METEDPIEYRLPKLTQLGLGHEIFSNFEHGLGHGLGQIPKPRTWFRARTGVRTWTSDWDTDMENVKTRKRIRTRT